MTTRSQEGQQMDGRFRDTTERRERGILQVMRRSIDGTGFRVRTKITPVIEANAEVDRWNVVPSENEDYTRDRSELLGISGVFSL